MADNENIKEFLEVDEQDRLTGIQVSRIVEDFARGSARYIRNQAYYEGKNVKIIQTGKENEIKEIDPNNVVPLPFARRTVNDLQGYAYKPGNVMYKFDEESNEQSVLAVEEIFRLNDEPLTSSEIFQDAAIKGEGAELLYFTDDLIQFAQIPREQCIFEYEDSVKSNKLKWAIRFYETIEVNRDGSDTVKHRADVYTNERVDFYQWTEETDFSIRNQRLDQNRFDISINGEYEYVNSELHMFGKVPLYPYQINSDKLGIYEASIHIIDKIDDFGSDALANAIAQFNQAILVLSKKVDSEMAKNIKELNILDNQGGKEEGNFVEFLQRKIDLESTIDSTELFERWYYELTGIVNLNGEKFGVKSGIAIAYALFVTENLVTIMEIYFSKGLQYRLELINNALSFLESGYEPVEATLVWKRNLPFQLKEMAEVVKTLKETELVSDESLLKMFPSTMIENAKAEIEKRREEQLDEIMQMQNKTRAMIEEQKVDIDE
jgi:SPP1 family phage portal protein